MPKIKYLYSEAERRAAERKQQRDRTIRIINAAAVAGDIDRADLCKKADIEYQTFNRRMRAESDFRLPELWGIANALNLDAQTRAAICGSKEKCRFEPGYRT